MENINKFTEETGFVFVADGEVGFGRPCVGIQDPETEHYIAYLVYGEDYEVVANHDAVPAHDAYHKHPCLAVLTGNVSKEAATRQLDEWAGRILETGYRVENYFNSDSISSFISGGPIMLKAIVNKA